ncbi:unnamed protein product [Prorocentrum cordatum]|uniref:Histone deacetylase domain-containing protein n=1 Tax=Prorocentrum cordatum TaxID=2364126 RepID=A0ABN9Y340_9DINO|nr:unnamed protein product [Polarella glacialis]
MVKVRSRGAKEPRSRKLVVVFDRSASAQVKSGKNVRRVPLFTNGRMSDTMRSSLSFRFHPVRRNKKIQTVMRMGKAETKEHVKMECVVSMCEPLSEIGCIYENNVIEVLRRPKLFTYKRNKQIEGMKVWSVMAPESDTPIMESDFNEGQLEQLQEDLECDIGVIKAAVQQLLRHNTHDVMAINTYPGHHAGPSRVAGFCSINNVAVAASLLKRKRPQLKLGVLDIDVHPGDGTQQFLERHKGLFNKYVSIHSGGQFYNCYSLGANGAALKLDRNRKVSAERLLQKIVETLDSWNRSCLDIVIVALGFDTLQQDGLAKLGFQMLPAHFHTVGLVLAGRKEQIMFVQEGGYNLDETTRAFDYLIKGLREGRKLK